MNKILLREAIRDKILVLRSQLSNSLDIQPSYTFPQQPKMYSPFDAWKRNNPTLVSKHIEDTLQEYCADLLVRANEIKDYLKELEEIN